MSTNTQRSHSQMGRGVQSARIVTSTTVLDPQDTLVHVASVGAMDVTFPEASKAMAWVPYVIRLEIDGNDIDVKYPGGTENPPDATIVGADGGAIVAMSDGTYWYEMTRDLGSA